MTTAKLSDNRQYLFRLQTLIIDGGTPVLRNIFDNKLPGSQLSACLLQEKSIVKTMKRRKILSELQYGLLYSNSKLPAASSKDFDLTLLICLLRNLKGCGLNLNYKWSVEPQSADHSMEADICRLRNYRNEMAHISATTGIDETCFNYKWDEIEQILLRLNSSVPNADLADLQRKIDGFKNDPLDPEEVAKLQKKWKEMEKKIEATMKDEKQLKREYVEELTRFYKTRYRSVSVSPLHKRKTGLVKFFVEPALEIVFRSNPEVRRKVKSHGEIFSTKSDTNTICLTGQAGCGKTTFAKMLCMIWCDIKTGRKANLKILKTLFAEMKQFDFLFYIPLRDVCDTTNVFDMIFRRVVKNLGQYDESFLKTLLKGERCLIILEGLDEWSCPNEGTREKSNVPDHSNGTGLNTSNVSYETCTIFTTTRQWKMNEISTDDVPSYVELLGIDIASQVELINNIICYTKPKERDSDFLEKHEILGTLLSPLLSLVSHIAKKNEKGQPDKIENKDALNLMKLIRDKNLRDISEIPVILIQLTCKWLDDKDIGDTKCEIYFNIIDLLLRRAEDNLTSAEDKRRLESVSECKNDHEDSKPADRKKKYRSFLKTIGKLAFEALFRSRKESSLMIEFDKANDILTKDELWCCLKIGLLMENESTKMQENDSTYSFIHKTFQEFFCAFYLVHIDENECISKVRNVCKSLKSVFEMENVLIYLCGLKMERFGVLSKNICEEVVANDEITKDYRCRIRFWFDEKLRNSRYLQEYQYLNISCIKECGNQWENSVIYLEDIFFEKDDSLEHLLKQNKAVLKSVTIGDLENRKFVDKCIELLEANRVKTEEKLNVSSELEDGDLDKLLECCSNGLRYLSLCSYKSHTNEGANRNVIQLSESQIETISNFENLRSLSLESFELEHDDLCCLTNFLSRKVQMEEIRLQCIQCVSCIDHEQGEKFKCQETMLDLSRHTELRSFELVTVTISQVSLNTVRLEECVIGDFVYPKVLDSILESLSDSSSMRLFTCSNLIPADVDRCLNTISQVPTLEQLVLKNIDLNTVNMSYIENVLMQVRYLWLLKSDISCLALRKIVEKVGNQKQNLDVQQKKRQYTEIKYQREHQLIKTQSEETNFEESKQLEENQREDNQMSTENTTGRIPQGKTGSDETHPEESLQQGGRQDLEDSTQEIQPIEKSQTEENKQQRNKQQESKQEGCQNQEKSPLQVNQQQEKSPQPRESHPGQIQQSEMSRPNKNRSPGKCQSTESNHEEEDRKAQSNEIERHGPVRITVYSCKVTPKTEFQEYKWHIRDSKHFKVLDDWRSSPDVYRFSFERNYEVNEDLTNNEALTEHTNSFKFAFIICFCTLVLLLFIYYG